MSRGLIFILLVFAAPVLANTYYVAPISAVPAGDDSAIGDKERPWLTWSKAFYTALPGDTVFFRGGIYCTTVTNGQGIRYIPALSLGHDGTAENQIVYMNYPDEIPILDCAAATASYDGVFNKGLVFTGVDYVTIKGLHVINVNQRSGHRDVCYGIWSDYSNHLRFEQVVVHDVMGPGFNSTNETYVEFINCDSYDNQDLYSATPGDYGQGWHGAGTIVTDGYKYFYGCRAWGNADQGFSASGTRNVVVFNQCWSFNNGVDLVGSDGHGFKIGYWDEVEPIYDPLVTYKNCIAAENDGDGFAGNEHSIGYAGAYKIYNNLSINNGRARFAINPTASSDAQELKRVLRNNIAYKNGIYNINDYLALYTHSNNSWDAVPAVAVSDDDFVSLDASQLMAPRKPDGSLPDISFGKLKSTSDLIDAGVDVGLPFSGTKPDIGWSEYYSSIPVLPEYLSSTIENATPSRLEMTFNLTLANIVPAASAFAVRVNSSARTVSSVAVSGTKVLLTLASPVIYGDVVTVAYTKPATNPLQTASGGQAASFSAQNVINNVGAVIPVYVSSAIENATPSRLEMTYNLTLANIVPAASAFAVRVNSYVRTINSVAVSGTKVLLTLSSPVIYGDVVTVAYTKPATNPLQTTTGGQAASISAQNVINNVGAVIPVYVSSVIENTTPSRLEITYNLTLANIVPAASAFAVRVNSTTRTVSSVAISGTKVLLTLASPVIYGDVVTVAYAKPATNPLQTASGGQAASFSAKNVTNNVVYVNQPPVVSIFSPLKSESFTAPASVTIEVTASDADGDISIVEFYQGSVKLGEKSTEPYSFTWKEVPEGSYVITAVAEDDDGSRTVSSPFTLIVEKSTDAINQIPAVSITKPGKEGKFKKNDKILIVASATDPDGSITKVEFKSGAVTLLEDTSEPYEYLLQNADTGKYVVTAVATDNLGAVSEAASTEITIVPFDNSKIETLTPYPNPNNGQFKILLPSDQIDSDSRVTIVNLQGQLIYQSFINNPDFNYEFDLKESPAGTYVIMVINKTKIVATGKFIIR